MVHIGGDRGRYEWCMLVGIGVAMSGACWWG